MTALIIVGDQAFEPSEVGTRYVRRCTRDGLPYGAGEYAAHCDQFHNSGRTRYWRHRERQEASR